MAYLDQHRSHHRTVTVITVAALHGVAIYALINGLAVHYAKEFMPVLTGRNIPIEPPPPPPRPEISKAADTQTQVDMPRHTPPISPPRGPDLVIDLLPQPLPQPVPTMQADPLPPPQPTPSFTPRSARAKGRPADWVTANDYPSRDLREGNQGVTRFSLLIGVDGRVESCVVTGSSGFPGLDEATCRLLRSRARFEAATDADGKRVTGSYASAVHWRMPTD